VDRVVVRLALDPGLVEGPANVRVALAGEPGVLAVPDDAVRAEVVGECREDRLRIAVCDEQVAPALAVVVSQRGEAVEQPAHPHVAGVCKHVVVEDEDGGNGAAAGGGGEPDVVGDPKVPSVPEQLHTVSTGASYLKPPALTDALLTP